MIPKSLHFIWLGDEARRPLQLIQTWVRRHPGWQVQVWGNDDLLSRPWRCQAQIEHWRGRSLAAVADIMRWEILHEQGGICVAADSICLRPLDEKLLAHDSFACWVHEQVEPGIVSAAYVGCARGNTLIGQIIADIAASRPEDAVDASASVGNLRLTRTWRESGYAALTVLPGCSFIPRHPDAQPRQDPGMPYACELWAGRLGLIDDLVGLDPVRVLEALQLPAAWPDAAALATRGAGVAAAPAPPTGINVFVLTIRTGQPMRDIVESLVRSACRHPQLRITVADGSMDADKAQWLSQLAASSAADVRLIFAQGIVERFTAGLQADKAWTLFVSDDDPYSINYIDAYVRELDGLAPEVAAVAPTLYVGRMGQQLLLRQVQPCRQAQAADRLRAWQAQTSVQGILYYSLIRTPIMLEWLRYLASRPYSPSYSDQLLTALVAVRGEIHVVEDCTVLVRDESNWATAQASVKSDMRFYPRKDLVVLHEAWWIADLVRMLDVQHHPELGVALRPRVVELLRSLFAMFPTRASLAGVAAADEWRAHLHTLSTLAAHLDRPVEASQLVRAFLAIAQWAGVAESMLLNARGWPAGPSESAARSKTAGAPLR